MVSPRERAAASASVRVARGRPNAAASRRVACASVSSRRGVPAAAPTIASSTSWSNSVSTSAVPPARAMR